MTQNQNKQILINDLNSVVQDIININKTAQIGALRTINTYLVIRNWLIGKRIDEELLTNRSNDYGKHLIENLSKELSKYGPAFDRHSLYQYLKFYELFPMIVNPLGPQSINSFEFNSKLFSIDTSCLQKLLPWTHYRILITIKDKNERDWYEREAISNIWSKRILERNIKTDYYHRVLSHQIEHKTNQLATIDQNDFLKSLYVFDFVNFKKNQKYNEKELERTLLAHLKDLILELGKGYTFSANQMHLRSNENDYYVDLVFYNSIMKCNVLIDLKVGKIQHKDIGQMELYLKLFDDKVKSPDDNPSIGIILSSYANYDVVKYLTLETDNHVVSAKYMTYLPSKQELLNEIIKCKRNLLTL